jgi:uncharacterized membrane protein YkgB
MVCGLCSIFTFVRLRLLQIYVFIGLHRFVFQDRNNSALIMRSFPLMSFFRTISENPF